MNKLPNVLKVGSMTYLDSPCPICGAKLILKSSSFGNFYGCEKWRETNCRGSVGCHSGTFIPLGFPASEEVKKRRIAAHAAFDLLWKEKKMSRQDAYAWLQAKLGIAAEEAHIGMFDVARCDALIDAVSVKLRQEKD